MIRYYILDWNLDILQMFGRAIYGFGLAPKPPPLLRL